jgi:hypothetical protein
LTSPLDEHEQEVHWLPFEPNRTAAATQFVSHDVQLEVAEAKYPARIGSLHLASSRFVGSIPLSGSAGQEIYRISPAVLHGQPPRRRSA